MDAIDSATCFIGYHELRGLQRRAVASFVSGKDVFVSGKDVFVCIPTGGGKLLCYSILLRVFNFREKESGMVIVVSPLVAFNLHVDPFANSWSSLYTEPSTLWQYCSWVC